MKNLLLVLSLSFVASTAQAEYIDGLVPEACKIVSKKGETVTCAAANAAIVNRAKAVGKNLTAADFKRLAPNGYKPAVDLDAVSLGILPDADTNSIYNFDRFVADELGSVVGVLSVSGYANSEMGVKIQLNVWTNLKGQITKVSVR